MNKLFAKSKKSKDKQKKKEELSQENDFLYGRSKRTGIGIAADTQSTRNDSISRGSEREFSASLNSTEKTETSMSTSYYRGESFEAVSARNEYDNIDNGSSPPQAAGGKSSGMSQEDIDRSSFQEDVDNSRRKSDKHRKERKHGKSDRHKSDRVKSSGRRHKHSEDGDDNDVDPHSRSSRKHRHRDRDRGDDKHGKSSRKHLDDENNHEEGITSSHRRRRTTQEEKDHKIKSKIRKERDAMKASIRHEGKDIKDIGSSIDTSHRSAADDFEQRRRRSRQQDEKDKKMKQSIREQRDAAKDLRSSTFANSAQSYDNDENDELEQRRRRQREQDEKDRKMKQSIREQRDAAKDLRSSAFANSVQSYDNDENDEVEQRRRRQGEQDEKDRKRHNYRSGTLRHASIHEGDEDNDYDQDDFEAGMDGMQIGTRSQKQEEANEVTRRPRTTQNLIDLHIAQFRATTKITDNEEYDDFDEVDANAPLEDFENQEAQRNQERRHSRRVSANTMKINAWQQKYSLKKALELAERTPEMEWLSSFYRCDPRWNIMKFFDEVAREGGEAPMDENLAASPLANLFNKASVFTVWRPTSGEAIKNMMLGIATGKGLDIKGKSAKRGNISSYVPFIQIYEDPHKEHVRAYIKDGKTIRVFYQSEEARNEANEMMLDIKDFMLFAAEDAMRVLSDEYADPAEQELAMKHLMYDDTNLNLNFVDTYIDSSHPVYGLDITERLFWESYVMMQDCSRPAGTDWDIGRNSELTFMDMNFKAIRNIPAPGEPRAVVYQMSESSPMEPRMLLMAYEEYGRVKPVVSDFDCFLLGSRGVKYEHPIPQDQIDLVKWSVKNISEVLDERVESDSKAGWMESWFKVLKKAALKGYYPKTPKYGNGDPKSYEIIEVAVSRLNETGCVRHGAECFNWFFPQVSTCFHVLNHFVSFSCFPQKTK